MKKTFPWVLTMIGFIFLLGGLLTYGLGINNLLAVPRPDLVVWGTSFAGIVFIVSGSCDLFVKKTKQDEIEEKDERNILIKNAAMATAYQVMSCLIAVALVLLVFTGYINDASSFTIMGAFLISQIIFVLRLWYLNKKM